jgi:hypothetical protein
MNKTIVRKIVNGLLKNKDFAVPKDSLKTSIGNIAGVFHIKSNAKEYNPFKLKIELDIYPDGDAFFVDGDGVNKEREDKLNTIFNDLISSVIKKFKINITNSRIVVFVPMQKNKEAKNAILFSTIDKIIEFIAMDDVVRSMNSSLRKKS